MEPSAWYFLWFMFIVARLALNFMSSVVRVLLLSVCPACTAPADTGIFCTVSVCSGAAGDDSMFCCCPSFPARIGSVSSPHALSSGIRTHIEPLDIKHMINSLPESRASYVETTGCVQLHVDDHMTRSMIVSRIQPNVPCFS